MTRWTSTFQPDCQKGETLELRAAFLAQRGVAALKSVQDCDQLNRAAELGSIGEELLELLGRDHPANAIVFDDPVFAIWLRFLQRALAKNRYSEAIFHAEQLPRVLARVEKRLIGDERLYVPESTIAVQSDDLDLYVMAAAPPTYDFLNAAPTTDGGAGSGHPLPLQAELIGLALAKIGEAWPEMKSDVLEYVKIFGYLPDADFRSCSAARYSGIVYLGNMDESVLDIEESIVHEVGHQVLYRLGELTSLTKPGTPVEANYVLPWSGSRRDLFGFFHAFYIYVLLVKYFVRRAAVGNGVAEDCMRRAGLILLGVQIARPKLQSDPDLSEQGLSIINELCKDIDKLQEVVPAPEPRKRVSRA